MFSKPARRFNGIFEAGSARGSIKRFRKERKQEQAYQAQYVIEEVTGIEVCQIHNYPGNLKNICQKPTGMYGSDLSRMTGAEAIWKYKDTYFKASWRKNFAWRVNECKYIAGHQYWYI